MLRRPITALPLLALASCLAALAACGSVVEESPSGGTSTTTGGQGTGGDDGGGCEPGTLVECYSGPQGTQDVGVCHAGAKKCNPDGLGYGPCEWEITPTAEDCATPEDEDCDGATPACPGATVWSASFGGSGNDFGQRVVIDAAGDIVVVGGFQGSVTLGKDTLQSKGKSDLLIAKFSPTGQPIWARGFGSDGDDYAADVAIGPMNRIVVTGSVTGDVDVGGILAAHGKEDILVLELEGSGDLLLGARYGGPETDIGYGIVMDAGGAITVTGAFDGTVDFGKGPLVANNQDIFLLRLSQDGETIWAKGFGDKYGDSGNRLALDAQGNLLLVGNFYGPVDFGTGPLVTKGYYDAFVGKFDDNGKALWVSQIAGAPKAASFAVPMMVAADPSGGAVLGGYLRGEVDFGAGPLTSAGGSDAFVARYDGGGKPVFAKRFGGSYQYPGQPETPTDAIYGVALNAAGEVILTGGYIDTIDFGGGPLGKAPYGDAFLVRLDPKGEHLFSKSFGTGLSYAVGSGVALTAKGDAVLTGYFAGTLDFGKGPLATGTPQESDLFLVEITP